ncbi:hypothetical protein CDD83_3405 [Cordyceps sp. RAO-2017]|nr:hypothetical protein CDD83_3405 [Cordyceps sp. RAO-2017]
MPHASPPPGRLSNQPVVPGNGVTRANAYHDSCGHGLCMAGETRATSQSQPEISVVGLARRERHTGPVGCARGDEGVWGERDSLAGLPPRCAGLRCRARPTNGAAVVAWGRPWLPLLRPAAPFPSTPALSAYGPVVRGPGPGQQGLDVPAWRPHDSQLPRSPPPALGIRAGNGMWVEIGSNICRSGVLAG